MSTQMQGWHQVSSPGPDPPDLGENYAALVAANPYRNQQYNKSPWQNFLTSLGIRTQADAWQENMNVQAAEYDAALAQKAYNEQFESPIQEASRMRQAGMNPDLQGIGDVAGASPMGDDPSTPMQSTGEEGKIIEAGNFIMSAVSTAFGIAKQFGELRALGIANSNNELIGSSRAAELAQWLVNNTRVPYDPLLSETENELSRLRSVGVAGQHMKIPRRFRRQFAQNLIDFTHSLDDQVKSWQGTGSLIDSKQGVARQVESKFFGNGSFQSMREVNKTLVELSDALAEIALGRGKAEESFNKDYFENLSGDEKAAAENAVASNTRIYNQELNPVAKASAENAQNEFSAQMKTVDTIINSSLSSLVHRLKRWADKGDPFSQGLLFSFALARMTSVNIGPKGASIGFNPQ